jgi:hypothetical protein
MGNFGVPVGAPPGPAPDLTEHMPASGQSVPREAPQASVPPIAAAAAVPTSVAAQPPQPPAAAADAATLAAALPEPIGGTKRARDGQAETVVSDSGEQFDSGERTARLRRPSSRYDM